MRNTVKRVVKKFFEKEEKQGKIRKKMRKMI